MAVVGTGSVSGVTSEQQGLLLQDISTGWHLPSLVSVIDLDEHRVQLTPAPQRKADSALHRLLSSMPGSAHCSAFCLP